MIKLARIIKKYSVVVIVQLLLFCLLVIFNGLYDKTDVSALNSKFRTEYVCGNIDEKSLKVIDDKYVYEITSTVEILGKVYPVTWYTNYNYKSIQVCTNKYYLVKDIILNDGSSLLDKYNTNILYMFALIIIITLLVASFLYLIIEIKLISF